MVLGQVIALNPTVVQTIAFARAAGTARFTYNWALAEWQHQYRSGLKPTANKLKKQFNSIKRAKFPWIMESPRDANSQAFGDLRAAFSNFFASCKGERKGSRVGYPKFRRKGDNESFYVANDKFEFSEDGKQVRLPVIGWVKIHEPLRLRGKITSGRVRLVAGKWYLSVQVDTEARVPTTPIREIVGVDLGIKTAVVPSHGDPFHAPNPLKKELAKLRRANRVLHRRQKGSKNRKKAALRLARVHHRIANVRKDFLHKVTTKLVRENQTVVIENLNVAGMMKNHKLARAISDVGFGMFRWFLEYKGPIFGCEVIVADRWFSSSKRCSACGDVKKHLALSERTFVCENEECKFVCDRDENASRNLEQYPRLEGNWDREIQTPGDDCASTSRPPGLLASMVETSTASVERSQELDRDRSRSITQ